MKSNRVVSQEEVLSAGSSGTTESAERVLVIERIFNAPPSLVFKAWTDPQHLVHWFGPRGFTLPSCELDLRPGGAWRSCMLSGEGREHWVRGVFRARAILPFAGRNGQQRYYPEWSARLAASCSGLALRRARWNSALAWSMVSTGF